MLEHKIPPPLVAVIIGAGMWVLRGIGPQLSLPPGAKYTAVGALAVAGVVIAALGIQAFRQSRTTVNPLKPEQASALVTGGIYRITRNPMYVRMASALLAWAVYLSALLPFLGVLAFVLFITRFQIQPEERVLARIFGGEYSAYASRVRRWL